MAMRRVGLTLGLVAFAAVAAPSLAQTDGADHSTHAQTGKPNASSTKMTDAEWVGMMLKHHQDGIAMSRLEEKGGASSEVKALAAKIREGQERDVPDLQKHQSHVGAPGATHADDMKHMEAESQQSMKRLQSVSGPALDQAFVQEMSKHHQQAINMVTSTTFKHADVRAMAQKMASTQKQELAELKKHQSAK